MMMRILGRVMGILSLSLFVMTAQGQQNQLKVTPPKADYNTCRNWCTLKGKHGKIINQNIVDYQLWTKVSENNNGPYPNVSYDMKSLGLTPQAICNATPQKPLMQNPPAGSSQWCSKNCLRKDNWETLFKIRDKFSSKKIIDEVAAYNRAINTICSTIQLNESGRNPTSK